MISEMDTRAKEIFKLIVDSYLESGTPVGSRTLSKLLTQSGSGTLSPASIRNVMADLEDMGLLFAPHTSAGRMPTQNGLRLFIDAMMDVGPLSSEERKTIDNLQKTEGSLEHVFEQAGKLVSGLSSCATLVATPTRDRAVRQIQFVPISPEASIAVIVFTDGSIENRMIALPAGLPSSSLISAGNYLNARMQGKTLSEIRTDIIAEIDEHRSELDTLSASVVKQGLAIPDKTTGHLYVRGTSSLLKDVRAVEDIEGIQKLIDLLDRQETMASLLQAAEGGQGVQIFIGSENRLFQNAGLSMVLAPARGQDRQIVGAIGIIGPTRLNYGRVVPIIDYTSQVMARLIG